MKSLIYLFVVTLMLSAVIVAQDATSFSPVVVDVRSMGMGNTQILSSTGSNALFSNPAILSTLDKMQIQLGGRGYMGSKENEDWDNSYYNIEAGNSFHPKLTHISFSMPIKMSNSDLKLALAGGYYNYFDWSGNTFYEQSTSDYKYENTEATNGGISMIALGAALNFSKIFNVGLSFNTSIYADVLMEGEEIYEGDKETYERETIFEGASFFTLSAYVTPTPELSLGAFYRPSFDLKGDKKKYTNNDGDVTSSDMNEKYEIPTFMGLGIGYKFSPSIVVNAEYQNRPFADIEMNGEDASEFIDNGHSFRVGGEINTGAIPLRFGLFLDDVFQTKEDNDTAPTSLLGVTAGLGFSLSNSFMLDLGFIYSSYSYERESFDPDTGSETLYETTYTYYNFALSMKYLFN